MPKKVLKKVLFGESTQKSALKSTKKVLFGESTKKVLKKALKKVLKKVLFGESTQKSTQKSTHKKQYKNHKTQKSTFETYSKKYSGSISQKNVLFLHLFGRVTFSFTFSTIFRAL